MAEGICYAILGRIGQNLVDPIGRQLRYLFCFNNNIQNLQTQLEDLKTTRDGVQLAVDQARNNVRIIEPQVEAWLIKVNHNTTEAEAIIESKAQVQKGCLKGLCLCHYSLSRKAIKKSQDLVRLQDDRVKFTQLSHSPPPPSIESIPTTEFQGFDSRTLALNEIIKALKDDGINLIGICGMGGIGKTTMAKVVAKRAKEENLFNEVPMTVVSQEPNLKTVQSCIAEMLGLTLDKENPIVRASLLRERLLQHNKKILVILDDIWEEFNLEDLGFPLGGDATKGGCKILFTSRFRNMWRGIQNKRYIQLEVLLKEEAWHLFKEKAGNCVDTPNLLPLAKEIVDECGGLPLALVTMGSALVNERNQHHWKDALRQLRTPSSESILLGVPAKVYQVLDFSYNFLKDEEAKKLFLLCCLFPEDLSIPIELLVRFVIGLQWFKGIYKVDEVRDRVYVLVDQLKSYYLLLDGDGDEEEEEEVKMHDVVRDVAISIASREKHAFVIIASELSRERPNKATYEPYTSISVISVEIEKFPDVLRCPKLVLLMILCEEKIPSNFFEGMGELKVLLLGITGNILLLPSSLLILSNLRTLLFESDYQFDNTSVIGELLNLEILSFRNSRIKELPEEIGRLTNLRLLDLTNCEDLERIPPGVLSALVQLEELYISGYNNFNWEGEGKEEGKNASLRELESLPNLNTLEIYIKDVMCLPRIPLFNKLTKYKILIGNNSDFSCDMKRFQKVLRVRLEDMCTILLECSGINSLLRSTQFLELDGKGSEEAVQGLFREGVKGLQQLMHLSISNTTLEYLVNTMDWVPHTPNTTAVFPILESLELHFLPNLTKICHGQLPSGSFEKLKCLKISYCDSMEEIIWKERGEEEDDATTTNKIEFPMLEIKSLSNLPRLVGFCRGIDEIEFPQLKELHLKELPQVKWLFPNNSNPSSDSVENHNAAVLSLFPHKVAFPSLEELNLKYLDNLEGLGINPISVGSFSKLRKLHVLHCVKFLYVFPSQLLMMLRNLESLTVEYCDLLEKVFELEMTNSGEQESEMLLLLKSLKLRCLPQLNYISKRDPIGFMYTPQLSILHVHVCDNLRYLFPYSVMKSNLQLQELEIRRCKMMSRIVGEENGQGKSLVDKIEFSQLKILRLYDLPNLVSFFPKVMATVAASTEHLQNVVQTLFNEKVVFPTLEVLELEHLEKLEGMGHDLLSSTSLSKLRKIYVRHCGKLLKVFPSQLLTSLQNLEEVIIKDCSLLKKVFELEVVDCTEHDSKKVFGFIYIPQLSILRIDGCDNLRFLFPQSMTKSMLQLQELEISNCELMSRIVTEENRQGESSVDKIEFAQLKMLRLSGLPNLVSFFPKVINIMAASIEHLQNPGQSLFNEKVAFPSLENLLLCGIQSMNEIWCNHPQIGSFYKLTQLSVHNCGSLQNLFSPFMAKYLVNLQTLVIDKCSMMEVVVAKEENEEEGEGRSIDRTPILPNLECLELGHLAVLKCFCQVNHDWELPLVDNIRILNCPEMKTFSPGVICTPKLRSVLVWFWMKGFQNLWRGDLNQTILQLNEKEQQERQREEEGRRRGRRTCSW